MLLTRYSQKYPQILLIKLRSVVEDGFYPFMGLTNNTDNTYVKI